jgi:hypothetical protein
LGTPSRPCHRPPPHPSSAHHNSVRSVLPSHNLGNRNLPRRNRVNCSSTLRKPATPHRERPRQLANPCCKAPCDSPARSMLAVLRSRANWRRWRSSFRDIPNRDNQSLGSWRWDSSLSRSQRKRWLRPWLPMAMAAIACWAAQAQRRWQQGAPSSPSSSTMAWKDSMCSGTPGLSWRARAPSIARSGRISCASR